jgi:prophage antirepressor-like protein
MSRRMSNGVEQERWVAVTDEHGEPWFVAGPIGKALGYQNSRMMTRLPDDEHKGVQSLHTPGGVLPVSMINQSGLYAAILAESLTLLGNKLKSAKAFKQWVTKTVLLSIRKDAMYAMGEQKVKTGEMSEVLSDVSWRPGVRCIERNHM